MTTKADKHLEAAREAVQTALEELSEIVIKGCPGSNDYTAVFDKSMNEALNSLIEIRQKLK